jgi:hypothetical protein
VYSELNSKKTPRDLLRSGARQFYTARRLLNSQKNLSSIHPEQDQPKDEQDRGAMKKRFVLGAQGLKRVLAQVCLEVLENESIK